MRLSETSIQLALPYNHDPNYAEWLDTRTECVHEVYLPVHPTVGSTARPFLGPARPTEYYEVLRGLAAVMKAHGVKASIVLNMPIWSRGRLEVPREIGQMIEIFGGGLQVTVGDFPLARDLRATFPEIGLAVSCAVGVESKALAQAWVDGVGVDTIVLGRDANKKPWVIREIRELDVAIKMVVDDACIPHCPAQFAHAALMMQSGSAELAIDPSADCFMATDRERRPWIVAQKDVVPATLPRFDGLVDIAKLDGRADNLQSIDRRRQLYLACESYEHVKRLYTEPPEALDKLFRCNRDCAACGWCARAFSWPSPPAHGVETSR